MKGIGYCDSENEWTSKTVERSKGFGDCDSENDWTSKTFLRTKGICDCDSEMIGQVKLL